MPDRLVVTATVDVERTPAEVFAYLADVGKHPEWSPKPLRIEGVTAGPVKPGDTFTSYGVIPGDKNHRNDVTVAECTAPTRLVLDATEKGEHFVNTFEVTARGTGSTLTRTLDMPKPGLPLALLMPLIKSAFIQPDVTKGLRTLKGNLERS